MGEVLRLPADTVTFLFSDIEGSTRLWEQDSDSMSVLLARHDALLRHAITTNGGTIFKTVGDEFCAAFTTAPPAVAAALTAQRLLKVEPWRHVQGDASSGRIQVRMALHTGAVEQRQGDYFGPPLNRVSRLLDAGHGGQILLSQATQELTRDHLPEGITLRDLGEHRLKDLARPERVFQVVALDLPADFAPLRSLDTRRHNLPLQRTLLLGREWELAALRKLVLRADVGLVTLTGPSGSGKTRLGLQVAADLLDQFADGAFFISLASIRDPVLVAATIAQTLGVQETSARPLMASLKEYLQERQVLLILDNFEQLLPAAPLVAELLAAAPRVKVLVTSRAVLHLREEKEFPVPPLALPDQKHLPPVPALAQYAAVALFIQRAQGVKPDFMVTNENAPAVAEICHRLDGLPLAIELAAARTKLFPPQVLLGRLESTLPSGGTRLKLLVGGARDMPERQQTLRGAIAWSYDLLDEGEQRLFWRLSVFAGGCTLEAAEPICNAANDLELDLVAGISSLVDKSLLRQEETAAGEVRFGMLATIQEFALDCLAASGEAETLRRQHARYFLEWTEAKVEHERLATEYENLRAALGWFVESGAPEEALRLAWALWWMWYFRGHWSEGRQWLTKALTRPDGLERTTLRGRVLRAAGKLAGVQGDYPAAWALLQESLAILRERGEFGELPAVLNALGEVAKDQGDYAAARSFFEESLTLLREQGDQGGLPWVLQALGQVAREQGDDSARGLFEESLHLFQMSGDRWGVSFPLSLLGEVAHAEGDFERARSLHEQSLAIRREVGHKGGIARSLGDLGTVAAAQGDYGSARSLYEESLALRRELGEKQGMVESLEGLAGVISALGEPARAARLFGAAQAAREAVGAPRSPADCVTYERWLSAARAALDEAAFRAAWAEGRALALEQAIAAAVETESGAF